ncbi:questin oxidase family protein [Paucibacter sp. R3-3]|uniref:Questin oxidase family protein n=1 Tax=Roseateles agri TaxID=3098619 RepID=A0ABU5DHY6_9BURK|nr:questin oxidase family protein [Paucibacter sp. R3-3]MDY0745909.1 questin oxidase family protein [Paucibacter sp. R3-3]
MIAMPVEVPVETRATPQQLRELLDAPACLPPEYGGGLANHLPMALDALQKLGASGERLRAFYDSQAPHIGSDIDPAFAALAAEFRRQLDREGADTVLRRALPRLLPGVAAAAFHGVIRTAHALRAGSRAELARGLAYWSWRHRVLDAPDRPAALLDFDEWSARLRAADEHLAGRMITSRMVLATQTPSYLALGAALAPQADPLRALAGLAVETYLRSRDFTVLHLVTGLHALRQLAPWLPPASELQPVLVGAFTAAYLAAQPRSVDSSSSQRDWPAVIAAAIASDNEHTIKLVHACREEAAYYCDPRYLAAAALATS